MTVTSRADCVELDDRDPLAAVRTRFELSPDLIYLDGNSLGPLPSGTAARMTEVIQAQWGQDLIRSWNDAGWFDKPLTVGDRLAPLVGAGPGEVVVCDSTSVNLFKAFTAALELRPGRSVVISETRIFPTDLYMLQGAMEFLGGYRRELIGEGVSLEDLLSDEVAVVVLSHVDYVTGRVHDMRAVTELIHRHGALVIWDLCHSVGALPIALNDCEVDFAVGCTYKYLNGGPGAPAFVFVSRQHQPDAVQPLSGWHGHAAPFAFDADYQPAAGVARFRVGTPLVLSYVPLEVSLDLWDQIDLSEVRTKNQRLTDLFIDLVERDCADLGLQLASPRSAAERGSQVALRHEASYQVVQALIARGVIGDFRAPDVMRFGFPATYVKYADVWDAVQILRDVLITGQWRDARFAVRSTVT
ncbi:kynureninase [Gordonia sp. TBRC 11910]|uniref:Kynureninase n=1 Tax=Gordonia asplenii TaxID=2725283 RepID=A0A848KWL2_9ACTN|nr:kynureninase [Gordonia asplenii]NMO02689.1 kynureninase [Gordonia asplenii]